MHIRFLIIVNLKLLLNALDDLRMRQFSSMTGVQRVGYATCVACLFVRSPLSTNGVVTALHMSRPRYFADVHANVIGFAAADACDI